MVPAWSHSGAGGCFSVLSLAPAPGPGLLLSPLQLLSSLTECLKVDPLSTSVWRQLYPKHLSQSRQVWGDHIRKVLGCASQPVPVPEAEGGHL